MEKERKMVSVRIRRKYNASGDKFEVHFLYGVSRGDMDEMEVKLPEKLDPEVASWASEFSSKIHRNNSDIVFYDSRKYGYHSSYVDGCILCTAYCKNLKVLKEVVRDILLAEKEKNVEVHWKGDTAVIQKL